jgi:hypothetical protein
MRRAPVQGTDRAKGGFGITASYPVPAGRCRDEKCQEQLLSPPKQLVLSVACAVPFASRHAAGKSARPHQSLGSYRTPQLIREVFMHIHELTVNECREVLKNTNIRTPLCNVSDPLLSGHGRARRRTKHHERNDGPDVERFIPNSLQIVSKRHSDLATGPSGGAESGRPG